MALKTKVLNPAAAQSAGDGRNQHHLVAVLERVGVAAQKADIFVVHVDVDEAPQLAGLVLDLGGERGKVGVDVGDQGRQIRGIRGKVLLPVGVTDERGGKNDLDGNDVLLVRGAAATALCAG